MKERERPATDSRQAEEEGDEEFTFGGSSNGLSLIDQAKAHMRGEESQKELSRVNITQDLRDPRHIKKGLHYMCRHCQKTTIHHKKVSKCSNEMCPSNLPKIEQSIKKKIKITEQQFEKVTGTIPNFATATLLFRGSEHKFKAAKFHEYCDGKGPTLAIVEADNGGVFGMFTDIPWASGSNKFVRKQGNSFTFAFSGGTLKKFPCPKGQAEIRCESNCLVAGFCFTLHDKCDRHPRNQASALSANAGSIVDLAGKKNFRVAELEVY